MFTTKDLSDFQDDFSDRKYYGTQIKLKKFDTEEFHSIPHPISQSAPDSNEKLDLCVDVKNVSFHYTASAPVLNCINLQVPQGEFRVHVLV